MSAARRRRAAVVEAHHHVAALRQHQMPQLVTAAPTIDHGLSGGLAVHIYQQRILLGRVKIRRFQAPAVQRYAVADIDTEELRGRLLQLAESLAQLSVVSQHAFGGMLRQFDQFDDRRRIGGGTRMDRIASVGRNLIVVPALLPGGRNPFEFGSVQANSIQVTLRGIVRRSQKIQAILRFIHVQQLRNVKLAGRRKLHVLPIAGSQIDVPPAVAVADPRETLTIGQPVPLVVDVNPGIISFGQDRRNLPRACVRQQDEIGVLAAIQLLQHETFGIRRPREPGEVMLARIAGHVQPAGFTAARADDAHAASRVLLADFGISERGQPWIQRVGVVDQGEFRDAAGIDLPIGDFRSIRAPGEAVPQTQLLLVHPIERAVDDVRGCRRS